MTPESKVKRRLVSRLKKEFGTEVWTVSNAGSQYGAATLDMFLCVGGLFYAVEIKRDDGKGKVTARQRLTLDEITRAGGRAFLVDSAESMDDLFQSMHLDLGT